MNGAGGNQCSTALQCGIVNHTVCQNAQCAIVAGPGGNQCDDPLDCSGGSSSFGFSQTSSSLLLFCGNGVIDPPESCDNATANSDTTPNTCRTDCTPARCGDFVVDTSLGETCDQGTGNSNSLPDRCRATCQLPACGDGIKDAGEQCDDGNLRSNDGCSATCTIESVLLAGNICGDGRLDRGESCDDGNIRPGDGCSAICRSELTLQEASSSVGSQRPGTLVASSLLCGDGNRSGFEECDDGNLRDRDGCSVDCYLERGFCGDSIVQRALGETCEPALHDKTLPFSCNPATCRFLSSACGDGQLQAGEECDLGSENNRSTPGAACRPDCSFPRCGDRIVDPSESCDDGNRLSGDGCSAMCTLEQGAPSTIPFPGQDSGTDMLNPLQQFPWNNPTQPWATLQPIATSRAPVGDTGPAAVAVMAAGAGAGLAWMRRRRK